MDTFDLVPHVRDLAIAYGLAVPIGWDREREERTAGRAPSRWSRLQAAPSFR
jgi:hypothetical protein